MMIWKYSDRYLAARAWLRGGLLALILAVGLAACQPLPPPSIRAATPRPADVTPDPTRARSETPDGPGLPRLLGSYPSPDGAWQAEVIRYDCADTGEGQEMALDVLRLIRIGDGQETIAARQVQYCGGLGAFGLGGLNWSPGGRYFYYTTAREGQPDGGCREWVPPVARVDVQNPLITAELAAAVRSPDGTKLAGWQLVQGDEGGRELAVWDVDGDEVLPLNRPSPAARPAPSSGRRMGHGWSIPGPRTSARRAIRRSSV